MVERYLYSEILDALRKFPVVALLGPRQVGKSTLSKQVVKKLAGSKYLDLEKPSDLNILDNAEFYFKQNINNLICIDEVQRKPDLFPLLRSHIDEFDRQPRFLLLGSASQELLQQSTESLAGRIKYIQLSPFSINEINENDSVALWNKGGFPLSYLAGNVIDSFEWRESFIQTYIERDLSILGYRRSPQLTRRLWTILAHNQGQLLNKDKISQALEISSPTVQSYIDMLADTFMIRTLRPSHFNIKKRLVKSPKVYIRDSGILHCLLGLRTLEDILQHPVQGASWEGFVIEQIIPHLPGYWESSFFRSSRGKEEIDLVLQGKNKIVALEIKSSSSPKLTHNNYRAFEEISPDIIILVGRDNNFMQFDDGKWIVPVSKLTALAKNDFDLSAIS